jgi:SAM-dependent methyltransferase
VIDAGRLERLAAIRGLRESIRDGAVSFVAAHQAEIDAYRVEISTGVAEALYALRRDAEDLTGGDALTRALLDQAGEYVDWMQWTFWDLPYYAAVLRPDRVRFRRLVAACGLVYVSFRIIDDLIDRHYLYRGRRPTLLATFTRSDGRGQASEGLTVLAACLLCFDGLSRLLAMSDGGTGDATLRQVVAAARRTLVGMILEQADERDWTPAYYERLIRLKNVDYWRILHAALDPDRSSRLYPFLVEYYTLAQRLNDVQDHSADEPRGQPNLLTILRAPRAETAGPAGRAASPATLAAVEDTIARDLLRMGDMLATLPDDERGVAALKLAESIDEAVRLGLFQPRDRQEPASAAEAPREPLRLLWNSTAEEFLERLGPDALEDVACPVCQSLEHRLLFRKQGFGFRRCGVCSHAFVGPRLRPDVQARIAGELDGLFDDPFLDVQRIQAEYLCRIFRRFARGPRLLDVGFGRGYLMHVAQAYGFQAYGVDSSPALLDRLRPVFGRRLAHADAGGGALPWGAFDVVAVSHVLEHLADPRETLARVRELLNADGLLYLAVPDMDSVQFRIFGKRWNAVSPVVHVQYFNERSLRRTLEQSGFEVISRLEHPPEPASVATRATRLFRQLGGSESGELAMLCRPTSHEAPADPTSDGAGV